MANKMAWNNKTIKPSTVVTKGPNKTAASPVPVDENNRRTDGIFSADKTKT